MNSVMNRYTGGLVATAGVIGYLVGLLTAPKSGRDLRRDLVAKADDLNRDATEHLTKARQALSGGLHAVTSQASSLKERADSISGQSLSRTAKLAARLAEHLSELKDAVSDLAEHGERFKERKGGPEKEEQSRALEHVDDTDVAEPKEEEQPSPEPSMEGQKKEGPAEDKLAKRADDLLSATGGAVSTTPGTSKTPDARSSGEEEPKKPDLRSRALAAGLPSRGRLPKSRKLKFKGRPPRSSRRRVS